ncbi:MAG: ferredoxin [Candidatus Omnitrophica bacterium]|nr:ferredoxin [Candidatus Omnitrophota bacterium]
MQAKVDQDKCIGSAQCTQTCPEVFNLEEGKAKVIVDQVPKDAEEKCKEAAENCPVDAITVQE